MSRVFSKPHHQAISEESANKGKNASYLLETQFNREKIIERIRAYMVEYKLAESNVVVRGSEIRGSESRGQRVRDQGVRDQRVRGQPLTSDI